MSDTTRGLVSARNWRRRTSASASVVIANQWASRTCGKACRRRSDEGRILAPRDRPRTHPIRDARSSRAEVVRQPLDVRIVGIATARDCRAGRRGRCRGRRPAAAPAPPRATRATTSPGCCARISGAGAASPVDEPGRARCGPAPCPASCAPAASRRARARTSASQRPRAADQQHPAAAQIGKAERRAVRRRRLRSRAPARSAAASRSSPARSRGNR